MVPWYRSSGGDAPSFSRHPGSVDYGANGTGGLVSLEGYSQFKFHVTRAYDRPRPPSLDPCRTVPPTESKSCKCTLLPTSAVS
jgi:hypothetical protein